jgi:hypothetical protein
VPTNTATPTPQPTATATFTPTATPTKEPPQITITLTAARQVLTGAGPVPISAEVRNLTESDTALEVVDLEVFSLTGASAQVLQRGISWNNSPLGSQGASSAQRITLTQRLPIPARGKSNLNFIAYVDEKPGKAIVLLNAQPTARSSAARVRTQEVLTAALEITQQGPSQSAPRSSIVGRITGLNNDPQPNVVVRAFRVMAQAAVANPYVVNGELGETSVVTDANGEYTITGLDPGTYRILPQFTSQEFFPASLNVLAGAFAPEIAAVATAARSSPRCQVITRSNALVAADQATRALQDLGVTFVKFYTVRLSGAQQAATRARLVRASGQLQRTFTLLLNLGSGFPTITYQCSEPVQCEVESRLPLLRRYSSLINKMRRTAISILRIAQKQQLSSSGTDLKRLSAVVRRHHSAAVKAWKQLPREARSCTEETG